MATSDWEARGRNWWSHVEVLADDSMEGRGTGTDGYRRAADYVIRQFESAGLEAAGTTGFLQGVDFNVSQLDEAASSLSLIRSTGEETLKLRQDAQIAVSSETVPELEADLVFVGYGLEIPEYGYSDLAGLDLKGKIVVFFRGGPSELPSPIKAHYASLEERWRYLRKAGVVGYMQMSNPKVPDLPWDRIASGLLLPRMELRETTPDEPRPLPIAVAFDPEQLDRLLARSGHTASELTRGLGAPGPLPRFPIPARLRARVKVRRSTARCWNVVGLLRGSDPSLGQEYVVGSAHLDHLGIGEPINGDPIYSGAMDNASGVATLIEIAKTLKESGERPKRSLVFLAVTGEEKGLLGSEYFAKHPTVPGPIVADLNMDMFLPLFPMKYLEVMGLDESTLGVDIRDLGHQSGFEAVGDAEPDRVLFIRSDQYNFVKTGVPSLMLSLGYTKGSPEENAVTTFLRDRYHSPADDLGQPVDKMAAAQFTDFLGRLMLRIANNADRPQWNRTSFFRRFAK